MWIKDIKDTQTVHNAFVRPSIPVYSSPVCVSVSVIRKRTLRKRPLFLFLPPPPPSFSRSFYCRRTRVFDSGVFFVPRLLPFSFLSSARDVSAARKKNRISKVKSCGRRSRDSAFERGARPRRFRPREPEIPGLELLRNGVIRIERLCGAPVCFPRRCTYIHCTSHVAPTPSLDLDVSALSRAAFTALGSSVTTFPTLPLAPFSQ